MGKIKAIILGVAIMLLAVVTLVACGGETPPTPTPTPVPPSPTPVPPSPTPEPTRAVSPGRTTTSGGNTSGTAASQSDIALILDAITQTAKLNSYHYNLDLVSSEADQNATAEGDYVAPNKGYIKGTVAGEQVEQLMVGNDVYVKDPGGNWVPRQVPTTTGTDIKLVDPSNFTSSANPLQGMGELLTTASNYRDLGEDNINGATTRHFSFEITAGGASGMPQEVMGTMGNIPPLGGGEVWVDPDTKYVHRLIVSLDLGPMMDMMTRAIEMMAGTPTPGGPTATPFPAIKFDMQMDISRHNDPSIKVPDAPPGGSAATVAPNQTDPMEPAGTAVP
jgi:hypothetical protein